MEIQEASPSIVSTFSRLLGPPLQSKLSYFPDFDAGGGEDFAGGGGVDKAGGADDAEIDEGMLKGCRPNAIRTRSMPFGLTLFH